MKKVELIPIFDDNYVFLILDEKNNEGILVDPGESTEIEKILSAKNIKLNAILITHHHHDHIGGLKTLKEKFKVPVWAPLKNKDQISADHYIDEADSFEISDFKISCIAMPGHTLGHVAYLFTEQNWLFSGDVVFGLGCGRLFEGSFEQGFTSLQKIKNLAADTLIYCTHEYTEKNLQFCKTLTDFKSPESEKYEQTLIELRKHNRPSVPLRLSVENKVNPFLRASSAAEFKALRELRNVFN